MFGIYVWEVMKKVNTKSTETAFADSVLGNYLEYHYLAFQNMK